MLYENEYKELRRMFKRYETVFHMKECTECPRYDYGADWECMYNSESQFPALELEIYVTNAKWELTFSCKQQRARKTSHISRIPTFKLIVYAAYKRLLFKTECCSLDLYDLTCREKRALLRLMNDFHWIEQRYYTG